MSTTTVIIVPPRFYWDHVDRELPSGKVVRENRNAVHVLVDRETFDEILADARYYATEMGEWVNDGFGVDPYARSVVRSARATVRRLEATTPPEPSPTPSAN